MRKSDLIQKAYQRGQLLNLKNEFYRNWIKKFILDETKGDVGKKGDITTDSIFGKDFPAKAIVYSRQKGILAGLEETKFLYSEGKIKVKLLKKDGDVIYPTDKIAELTGSAKSLLRLERSSLDIIQRMSGISTLTNNMLKKIKKGSLIAPTRKTQWRYLDKKAVFLGGGLTHRLALWESILIKDSHLLLLDKENLPNTVTSAIKRAWKKKNKSNFVEIEVQKKEQAIDAAQYFKFLNKKKDYPCIIMLDNMSPQKAKETINSLKKLAVLDNIIIECSGGIVPSNITAFSRTGADVLSLGYLTHSSHALDIKQRII